MIGGWKSTAEVVKFAFQHINKMNTGYIAAVFLSDLLNVLLPFVNIFAVQRIIFELTTSKIYSNAVFFALALFIINAAIKIIRVFFDWYKSVNYLKLADMFFYANSEKFMNVDYECLENPDNLQKMTNMYSVESLPGRVLESSSSLISHIFGLLGCIAIIAALNPLFIILIAALSAIVQAVSKNALTETMNIDLESAPIKQEIDYLNSIAQDGGAGKELRLFSIQEFLTQKLINRNKKALDYEKKKNNIFLKAGLLGIGVNNFQTACLYIYMAYMYTAGVINISQFSMFLGAVINFTSCVTGILSSNKNISAQKELIKRYNDYNQMPEKLRHVSSGKKSLPPLASNYEIKFNNVSFKYPNGHGFVLENINFTAGKGETVCVIGKNGAGKSTLVKLICRLYDPTEGAITLNGINIKDFAYDDYMGFIATVFQDFKLFPFTVRDNLDCRGVKSNGEIWKVLSEIGLAKKMESLPDGIESRLLKGKGWDAIELSGGENQKMAISRAYLKDSGVVVMDEPAAAVDPISEHNIYKSLNSIIKNRIAVFISHRMSSTYFADKILFIDNKTVFESGNHEELMALNGEYAKMFKVQAKYYK